MCNNKYRFGVNSKKLMDRIPSPVGDCLILDNFPDVTKLDGTPYFEKWDGDTVTGSSQLTLHITSSLGSSNQMYGCNGASPA